VLAVASRHSGGPHEVNVASVPTPVPTAGEEVVRNRCIGLDHVDLQHREGAALSGTCGVNA